MNESMRIEALKTVAFEVQYWGYELGSWHFSASEGLKDELNQLDREMKSLHSVLARRVKRLTGEELSSSLEEHNAQSKYRQNFITSQQYADEQKLAQILHWHSEDEDPESLGNEFSDAGDHMTALLLKAVWYQRAETIRLLQAHIDALSD